MNYFFKPTRLLAAAVVGLLFSSMSFAASQAPTSYPMAGASNITTQRITMVNAPEAANPFFRSYNTWYLGAHVGGMAPIDFFASSDFTNWVPKISFGVYLKKQFLPQYGLRAEFQYGQLCFGNKYPASAGLSRIDLHTDAKIAWSGALTNEFTLGNINWNARKNIIFPYALLGIGVGSYEATTTDRVNNVVQLKEKYKIAMIPVGAGVKFLIGPGAALNVGYLVNFYTRPGQQAYDMKNIAYGFAGVEMTLGSKSKSSLASKPSLAYANPVADLENDYIDKYRSLEAQIANVQAVTAQQLATNQANVNTQLSTFQANMARQLSESASQKDSNTKQMMNRLQDLYDSSKNAKQPDVKVYVTEADRKVVKEAVKNLEFDFGKSTIRSTSFPSLDKLAQVLISKNLHLKLTGYTDNKGSAKVNLKVSKSRADAVKNYLVEKGATAENIISMGLGKAHPIATNATEAGRQQNRRVEFVLY